jgi:hypothetical protein
LGTRNSIKARRNHRSNREKHDANRTREKAGEMLKNVLPSLPIESAEIPLFFDNIENPFTIFGIDPDIFKLLMPLLRPKAHASVGHVTAVVLDKYMTR